MGTERRLVKHVIGEIELARKAVDIIADLREAVKTHGQTVELSEYYAYSDTPHWELRVDVLETDEQYKARISKEVADKVKALQTQLALYEAIKDRFEQLE